MSDSETLLNRILVKHQSQLVGTLQFVIERLLLIYTPPDECVVDSFMGSGTTLVAAKKNGRYAIGIEINEQHCEIAAQRLARCHDIKKVVL